MWRIQVVIVIGYPTVNGEGPLAHKVYHIMIEGQARSCAGNLRVNAPCRKYISGGNSNQRFS